jgi:hypothetical protein
MMMWIFGFGCGHPAATGVISRSRNGACGFLESMQALFQNKSEKVLI